MRCHCLLFPFLSSKLKHRTVPGRTLCSPNIFDLCAVLHIKVWPYSFIAMPAFFKHGVFGMYPISNFTMLTCPIRFSPKVHFRVCKHAKTSAPSLIGRSEARTNTKACNAGSRCRPKCPVSSAPNSRLISHSSASTPSRHAHRAHTAKLRVGSQVLRGRFTFT